MAKSLPIDMIRSIAEQLPRYDLARLCLISREVSESVLPILYRLMIFRFDGQNFFSSLNLLRALHGPRSQESLLSRYASCVQSAYFLPAGVPSLDMVDGIKYYIARSALTDEITALVGDAISRFEILRHVCWPFVLPIDINVRYEGDDSQPPLQMLAAPFIEKANEMWRKILALPKLEKIFIMAEIPGGAAYKCSSLRSAVQRGLVFEGCRGMKTYDYVELAPDGLIWGLKRLKADKYLVMPTNNPGHGVLQNLCVGMEKVDFEAYRKVMKEKTAPDGNGPFMVFGMEVPASFP